MDQANTARATLSCQNLTKTYRQGQDDITVLNGINLEVQAGETLAIVGASGAGKSTLLNCLGGLDLPSSGEVWVAGQLLSSLGERARGELRNRTMGFVYQFHHLLPEFSALENVIMPLLIGKISAAESRERAAAMLEQVGLGHRLAHKPSELSGGERQRVAIARALVTHPQCVFMDEPTGNLDSRTAKSIQNLMEALNQSYNTCFVVVTHDETLAQSLDRTLYLQEGKLHTAESMKSTEAQG